MDRISEDHLVSQHLQDCFVYLAITSDDFLSLVRPILIPGFFTSTVSQNCVQLCYDYYDQFRKAPKDHFHDELVRHLPLIRDEDRTYYAEYLKRVAQIHPPDVEYIIRRVDQFCRCREYEKAAIDFAELVQRGDFDSAVSRMNKALKSGVQKENIGCDFLFDYSGMYRRDFADEVLISTGVPALDMLIRGYRRKQFICYLGGYKGKKSWALQHLAYQGCLQGKNVVYVSHELEVSLLEKRFDRMIGCLVSSPEEAEVVIKYYDNGKFRQERVVRPSVYNVDVVKKARRALKRFGGRLILKKYPMYTCTIDELNRYLDYLERFENFIPDLLISDYGDIMRPGKEYGEDPRHGVNEIYMGIKTICDERNIVGATASQGRRTAIRKKRPSQQDVAEEIRKLAHVDTMIGVCQTDEMAESEIGSLWVVVNREGIMDVGCNILMNLDVGQFCTSSWIETRREIPNERSQKSRVEEKEDASDYA